MLKKRFLTMFLAAASLFTLCACAGTPTQESQSEPASEAPPSEAPAVSSEVSEPENWLDALTSEPFAIFDFSEGKDMYGDKTINIIGDSISQGLNSDLFYDYSWAALFKEAIAKKYGTHNIGYVSLLDRTNEAVPGREIHTISFPQGEWERYYVSGNTPGGMSYATHQQGSVLRIEVNRQEGGKDRFECKISEGEKKKNA